MPLQSSQKSCGKIVLVETEISLQLKYSVSRPVVVACQKDSWITVEKCTQVKPVILTAIIFAVHLGHKKQTYEGPCNSFWSFI